MNNIKETLPEGTIVEKAYEIILDKLEEGYLSDNIITHAETRNEAKNKLLNKVRYEDWKLKYFDEELNYLNIPIRRRKSSDKVIFEGKEVIRCNIEEIIQERERLAKLDEILKNPEIEYCYISKGSYYCPNWAGYTSWRSRAGVYNKEEAIEHAKSCREITIVPINKEEHNEIINKEINDLKTRLI